MKLFYGIILVLIIFVSACAQQPAAEPEAQPEPSPEPEAEPEPEPEVEREGTGAAAAVQEGGSSEIRYVGAGGFDPDELTISAGSSVTWINDDNSMGALIIYKDGKSYTTGKRMVPDGKIELELSEPGDYEYWWNLAFGAVSGKITVE